MEDSQSRTQLQAEIEILQQELRKMQEEIQEVQKIQRVESNTVKEMMTVLARSANLDEGISIVLVNLRTLVPFDLAGLFLLSRGNRLIDRGFGGVSQRIHTIPDDHPLVAELHTRYDPLILSDIHTDDRFRDWIGMKPIRNWMGVPIRVGDEMVAFLSLGSLHEGVYHRADALRVSEFITPLSDLFELAQKPGAPVRLAGSLEVISHLSLALGQAESREETFKTILTQISRLFDPAEGVFLFPNTQANSLEVNFAMNDRLIGIGHSRTELDLVPTNPDSLPRDPLWQAFDSGEICILNKLDQYKSEIERPLYQVMLEGKSSVIFIPLTIESETFAVLTILFSDPVDFSSEDHRLVESIAQITSATFQRLFTLEALETQLSEERSRLIEQTEQSAVMEERQRLARELHDSVTQLIYSQVLFAGAGLKVLRSGDASLSEEYLQRIHTVAQQALKEMRLLVFELRPQEGLQDGLIPALQRRLDAVERRADLQVKFELVGSPELEESTEIALYYISMEAFNNILKHSEATEIEISLRLEGNRLVYEILDNGCGFEPREARSGGGMGLVSMRERAIAAGGDLELFTHQGEGTRLKVTFEDIQ